MVYNGQYSKAVDDVIIMLREQGFSREAIKGFLKVNPEYVDLIFDKANA
jgi:hypothetical protein